MYITIATTPNTDAAVSTANANRIADVVNRISITSRSNAQSDARANIISNRAASWCDTCSYCYAVDSSHVIGLCGTQNARQLHSVLYDFSHGHKGDVIFAAGVRHTGKGCPRSAHASYTQQRR